jgi:hypothetical protein
MTSNYVLNNAITYRDQRLRGKDFLAWSHNVLFDLRGRGGLELCRDAPPYLGPSGAIGVAVRCRRAQLMRTPRVGYFPPLPQAVVHEKDGT